MDVRSFKLRPLDGHVRAVVADGAGERGVDLFGDAAQRVFDAGAPLVAAATAALGRAPRALSVDVRERVLRASLGGEGAEAGGRLDGAAYDALVPHVAATARAIALQLLPPQPLPTDLPNDRGFWSRLWQEGRDGWELGRPAPPIERWIGAQGEGLRGLRALVPGCGRGHEVRLLARAGAHAVGLDFAPEAVAAARALAAAEGLERVEIREGDLFALPAAGERWQLVVEHTCFCAIDPARRADYARVMAEVIEPGGRLLGLFYAHGRSGGPPFSTSADEIVATFARWFDVGPFEVPHDSVATRSGQERLAVLRRR